MLLDGDLMFSWDVEDDCLVITFLNSESDAEEAYYLDSEEAFTLSKFLLKRFKNQHDAEEELKIN